MQTATAQATAMWNEAPAGSGEAPANACVRGSRVALLMPAYNPGGLIYRALESVARSTYPCDIYIVDDASTPPVAQMLGNWPQTKIIRLERNSGPAHARNVGLMAILSKPYDFVALLDSDDLCHPDRIATQVAFLDAHPEIGAVGSWARIIEENSGRFLYTARPPANPEGVKKALFQNAIVINSSLMIRTDVLRTVGLYSERYPVAEDYELLRRMAEKFAVTNIPQALVDYRMSAGSISMRRRRRQLLDRLRIQLTYFDAAEPHAWIGLGKTLLMFLVPTSLIPKLKALRERHRAEPVRAEQGPKP